MSNERRGTGRFSVDHLDEPTTTTTSPCPPTRVSGSIDVEPLVYDAMSGLVILAMGGANVVMQLAHRPVGRGVAESEVESGSLTRHPLKRTRTTLGYIGIAMLGSEEERAAYRREINRVHRLVRSNETSDVAYDAFDPELQLWVAACLYVGLEQIIDLFYADRPQLAVEGFRDAVYQHASRLATTLQVPAGMWPADREAFERYWNDGVAKIEMDDVTRSYLRDFVNLRFLPAPLSWMLGPGHRFITNGFLPAPFRDELGLPWSPRRQRAHDSIVHATATINRLLPPPIRRFPLNLYLWDARRRIHADKPIV